VNTVPIAQAIVDGRWRHAAEARAACRDGTWAAFVASTAPERPVLVGRFDHGACVERAASMFSGAREVDFEIVPVWACGNDDEEPSGRWCRAHAIRACGEPLGLAEVGPIDRDADPQLDVRVRGRARAWDVGNVVRCGSYAPDIDLALRRGDFGVLAGRVLDVLGVTVEPGVALPPPTIVVPPFCAWVEPRVDGLAADVRRAIVALSITVDDEGRLIPRPDLTR
jgi:hypothetical protein